MQSDDAPAAVLPTAPTTIREFPADDQIALLTEIYDNDRRPHRVDISSHILTSTGELVFTTTESRSNQDFGEAGIGTYGYMTRLPLRGFDPGLYVLRIEARSRADRVEPVSRDVQFRIRD
jgi:hypothetical protein